jgi:hypothetical protein
VTSSRQQWPLMVKAPEQCKTFQIQHYFYLLSNLFKIPPHDRQELVLFKNFIPIRGFDRQTPTNIFQCLFAIKNKFARLQVAKAQLLGCTPCGIQSQEQYLLTK